MEFSMRKMIDIHLHLQSPVECAMFLEMGRMSSHLKNLTTSIKNTQGIKTFIKDRRTFFCSIFASFLVLHCQLRI